MRTPSIDLNICVYDERGREVRCDVLADRIPWVPFTAGSTGRYRAVLNAFSINGSRVYAGMIVLLSPD